jgi:hypothetical protein
VLLGSLVVLVGLLFAVMGFWALWVIFTNVCAVNIRCHGNTVKDFWLMWDNIYDYIC